MHDLEKELTRHVGYADWVGRYRKGEGVCVLPSECRGGGVEECPKR
jgi:hypothetical protein